MHKIRVVPLFVIVKDLHNNVGFNANWGFYLAVRCNHFSATLQFAT